MIKIFPESQMKQRLERELKYILPEIPESFREHTLADYRTETGLQRNTAEAVGRYIGDVLNLRPRPLVLFGPVRTAKTLLASAIYKEVAPLVCDRSEDGSYGDAQTDRNAYWIRGDELRAALTHKPQDGEFQPPTRYHYETATFAVLDDLDKFPSGQWASELFGLIDSRLLKYQRATVITMNLSPPQFARKYGEFGDPIVSRMKRAGALFVRTGQ